MSSSIRAANFGLLVASLWWAVYLCWTCCKGRSRRWGYFAKTVEDYSIATLLLIFTAPLMVIIAIALRLDSTGPIIFRQKRYGFNNGTIEIFKFRTMRAYQDHNSRVIQARRDDTEADARRALAPQDQSR